jgi:hypothetical protein
MEFKSIRNAMILHFRDQLNRDYLTKLHKYKKSKEEKELRQKQMTNGSFMLVALFKG